MNKNAKRIILIGILSLILIAPIYFIWHLSGFNLTFIQGFFVGFIFLLAFALPIGLKYRKNYKLEELIKGHAEASKQPIRHYIWFFIIGVACCFIIYNQLELVKLQKAQTTQLKEQEAEINESMRISSLVTLIRNVLDKVDYELSLNGNTTLSESTIERIADLSNALVPTAYDENDSLKTHKLSPERGILFLALSKIEMDSLSFDQIKLQADFSGAALKDADLEGLDLRGAKLNHASFEGANLNHSNLENCNLQYANLEAAQLKGANLQKANLNRASLKWANLQDANLNQAFLNGADFTSAKLRGADLSNTKFRFGRLTGAFLNHAKMMNMDLTGTDCEACILSKANLRVSNLKMVNFLDANLKGAKLDSVKMVNPQWIETLKELEVIGAFEIQEDYSMHKDQKDGRFYRLSKKE